ncbi:MAG: nucleotide sugar dehydrogenase [Candidatus Hydrogenedentes bacterium]|nr:nucleotide sugar dehydrogenase [Candidatus Hydrogenedentota bacterium]
MKCVCVIGLGYIGLPTASILATSGFHVLGVDIDAAVVATVNQGDIHIEEPGLHTVVRAAIQSGNLKAALKPAPADAYILAVPTPLTDGNRPDMSHVRATAEAIVPYLRRGALVILESTSPPGTCLDMLVPILESSGLNVGPDIHLAHCPERVLPGHILRELISNDRIIGGFDSVAAEKARDLYATFVDGPMHLTDLTTAEFVKVLENTYRDVNIALANEAALFCEGLGIQFSEAARLANRHPRVNVHQAGPGVGGHCISVDPWFLVDRFPEKARLIRLARLRNDGMPAHVADTVLELLAGLQDPRVAALGLAYKGNIDDTRESPAVAVIRRLLTEGIEVVAHDPFVRNAPVPRETLENALQGADCLLVLTDHDEYRHLGPAQAARLMRGRMVYDTRNVLCHADWREAGFSVRVLGGG